MIGWHSGKRDSYPGSLTGQRKKKRFSYTSSVSKCEYQELWENTRCFYIFILKEKKGFPMSRVRPLATRGRHRRWVVSALITCHADFINMPIIWPDLLLLKILIRCKWPTVWMSDSIGWAPSAFKWIFIGGVRTRVGWFSAWLATKGNQTLKRSNLIPITERTTQRRKTIPDNALWRGSSHCADTSYYQGRADLLCELRKAIQKDFWSSLSKSMKSNLNPASAAIQHLLDSSVTTHHCTETQQHCETPVEGILRCLRAKIGDPIKNIFSHLKHQNGVVLCKKKNQHEFVSFVSLLHLILLLSENKCWSHRKWN